MMAPHKRSAEEAESLLVDIRAILLDIEGTTTPISYTEDTIYPYVKKNVVSYLNKNYENAEVQKAIAALRDQAVKDKEEKVDGNVEILSEDASKEDIIQSVAANVRWQMDKEKNTRAFQTIQDLVCRDGYKSKEITGELYEDVGPMLKMVSEEGFHVFSYCSSSIESQKQLFANSTCGDLSDVFTGYFDLTVGGRTDKASYKKIAAEINYEPKEILSLTHDPEEAEAAVAAGLRSALVIRPGNIELTDEHLQKFACIERFDELYGDDDEDDDIKRFAGGNGEHDDEDDEEEEDEDDDGEGEDDGGDDA